MQATAISASTTRRAGGPSASLRDSEASSFSEILSSKTALSSVDHGKDPKDNDTTSDAASKSAVADRSDATSVKREKGRSARGKNAGLRSEPDTQGAPAVPAKADETPATDTAAGNGDNAGSSATDHQLAADPSSDTAGDAQKGSDDLDPAQFALQAAVALQAAAQPVVRVAAVEGQATVGAGIGDPPSPVASPDVPALLAAAGIGVEGQPIGQAKGEASATAASSEASQTDKSPAAGVNTSTNKIAGKFVVPVRDEATPATNASRQSSTETTKPADTGSVPASSEEKLNLGKSAVGESASGKTADVGSTAAGGTAVPRDAAQTLSTPLATGSSDASQISSIAALQAGAGQPTGLQPPASHPTALPTVPQWSAAEARFAAANNPQIVTGITTKLLPEGGTMTIRLDPPELGAVAVQVKLSGGQISASLMAENADSVRLLTHSISSLRDSLEASGVVVDRLEVSHNPKPADRSEAGNQDSGRRDGKAGTDGQTFGGDAQSRQSDRHRQAIIDRLWAKVTGDPLNVVI